LCITLKKITTKFLKYFDIYFEPYMFDNKFKMALKKKIFLTPHDPHNYVTKMHAS